MTAECRCVACKQWSADYARDRKRARTGRVAREWSPAWRNPTEYLGADVWRRIWNAAVDAAGLPFPYTPYQVRHTHASWLIDQGVDLARVQYRLGHGDLKATTRYVNSRELHQAGEKLQVSSSQDRRNGTPLVLMPAL